MKAINELLCRQAGEDAHRDLGALPLIKGDPATALKDPDSVILSQALAAKIFGNEDPLGRALEIQAWGEQKLCKVTGIARDVPRNSHFRFEMLVSMKTFFKGDEPGWTSNNFTTYLLLRKGVTEGLMEEKLVELEKLYCEGGRVHIPWTWTLEPVTRIHLHADLATGNQPNGSAAYINLFSIVAALILLIAGINFVNLATARSARRAREVGIRKIVGSYKRQLIGQFLGESMLLGLLALVFAVGLIQAALPFYRNLTGRTLGLAYFGDPLVIPGLVGLAAFVTEQRTREIGVRKVLGADLSSVVWLLTRQFVKWVIIATLMAWPVGYWVMSR